jgi:hypothetical protein
MRHVKFLSSLLVIALLTLDCASPSSRVGNNPPATPPPEEKVSVILPSDEADIIREIFGYLHNQEGATDYSAVTAGLESFVVQYPDSNWTSCAQIILQTINKLTAQQNKATSDRLALEKANADKSKLVHEIEMLKTDAGKLQQENDQLRNDIALLKRLEIQQEKRGKMLR